MKLQADVVAKAFNDKCPSHWKARPYLHARQSGTFNAASFAYKGGMVSFLMDCDKPVGAGFQIKFVSYTGAFGDYLSAIQKGLYHILSILRDAELAPNVPDLISPSEIMFGVRKDGAINYLVVFSADGGGTLLSDTSRAETASDSVDDLI